jgi:hypothetical protein
MYLFLCEQTLVTKPEGSTPLTLKFAWQCNNPEPTKCYPHFHNISSNMDNFTSQKYVYLLHPLPTQKKNSGTMTF